MGEIQPKSHGELLNKIYRHTVYVYDFSRKFYLIGRDRLLKELPVRKNNYVYEVGCGTGRNLRVLDAMYPGAHLHGFDACEEMLSFAKKITPRTISLSYGFAESFAYIDKTESKYTNSKKLAINKG